MITREELEGLRRILIIDDEVAIRKFLRTVLDQNAFELQEASDGAGGLAAVATFRPEIVLLDLGLPDIDGIEVIRRLREWTNIPIIVLSVRDRDEEKVQALDAGADDYLTKPFSVVELLARIRVVSRRLLPPDTEPVYRIDGLEVDLPRRRVSVDNREIALTPTEYELLRLLVSHAGKVLTHRQLLKQIWGINYLEQPHILRVTLSNLRHKIEAEPSRPRYILTEPGVGYRLRAP